MYLRPLLSRFGRLRTFIPPLDNPQSSDSPDLEAQDSHCVDIPSQDLGAFGFITTTTSSTSASRLALEVSVTSINDLEKEIDEIDSRMAAIEQKAEDVITSMGNRIGFLLSYTGAWVFYQHLELPCTVIGWIAFVSVIYLIGGLWLAICGAMRELKKMITSVKKLDQERGDQIDKAQEIINSETSRPDSENQNASIDDISQLHPTEKSDSVIERSKLIKNSEKYLSSFKTYYWLYVFAAIMCVVLNVACICCISYFTYCHAGVAVGDSVPEASPENINSSKLPPHLVIDMPALSPTMNQGNIVKWRKKEGDKIEVGDILHEMETDKATTNFESRRRVVDENDVEAVRILSSSNNVVKEEKSVHHDATAEVRTQTAGFNRISPAAKVLIVEYDLDASSIPPSGPRCTLSKADVLAALRSGEGSTNNSQIRLTTPSPPRVDQRATPTESLGLNSDRQQKDAYEDLPNNQICKVIAARLLESMQSAPPLYLSTEKYDVKVSVNDIVIKVVATALRNVPEANVYWDDGKGELVLCDSVDISVAVATEKGLMTPIIRNADQKSISSISAEVEDENVEAVRTSSNSSNVVKEEKLVHHDAAAEVRTQTAVFNRISPAAKVLIAEHNLDASSIPASGPHLALSKRDVLAALKSGKGSTNNSAIRKAPPSPPPVDQICKAWEFERRRSILPRKFLSLV